ncbi:GNAT family N-acetyltransferase [Campylobacter upsaliensis]|uniref:GNAT family N-acetyltransferase n=1 Tax=Campylobacter upsaliensis TaxID=28080 RepID=UPI0012CD2029|nr:GNAT family N-acetyltransferase [Campylobacter upsaliensis]MBT0742943.1 GNAT family N-acetyltransferase [Campylobacter upsaliensis]
MISVVPYNANIKESWNLFNRDSKNGIFMFDRNYMDYHADRFIDHSLMFYEDSKLIALLPLNIKDCVLYSHQGLTFGGFIVDYSMRQQKMLECFCKLQEYMREIKSNRLIYKSIPHIYHKVSAEEDLYALFRSGAKIMRIDCSATIYLQNPIRFSELRKRGVKKALKNEVQIESSTNFPAFITLLNEVLQTKHNTQAVHSAKELELLHNRFKDNITLYIAKQNNEILAATLLFIYPNLVHTQYLATSEKGRAIGALDLLIKTLIDKYATTKQYFDFGISTENNGLFLNEGLIAQKEGFGARTIVHSFYELNINGGGGVITLKCFATKSPISWHTQYKRFKYYSSKPITNFALNPITKGAA